MNPFYAGAGQNDTPGATVARAPHAPVLAIRRRAIAAALALLVASWLLIALIAVGHPSSAVAVAAHQAGAPGMSAAPAPPGPPRALRAA